MSYSSIVNCFKKLLKVDHVQISKFVLTIFIFFISCQPIYTQVLDFNISETGHAFFIPKLDVNSSGHFFAIWNDYRHSQGYGCDSEEGGAIYVQKLDKNGARLGDNFRLDEKYDNDISNTNPDIAINKVNGNVAVVWQERSRSLIDGSRKSTIIASIFSSEFNKIAFQFIVDKNQAHWQAFPEVKYISNNNILIVWQIIIDNNQFYLAKIFGSKGNVIKDTFLVNSNSFSSNKAYFDIIPSGGFYFIWESFIQFYDNCGTPTTECLQGSFKNVIATKSLTENYLLILSRTDDHRCLEGLIYDRTQNICIKNFRVDDDTTSLNRRGSADIAINQSGDFIVVWSDGRNDYNNLYDISDVYAQRYSKVGQRIGINFKVNHENEEIKQYTPKVSCYQNRFVCIYSQPTAGKIEINSSINPPLATVPVSSERNYIVGTSQLFACPLPGKIYGWEYFLSGNCNFYNFLNPPYPNPFIKKYHQYLTINFILDIEAKVSCNIYNMRGQRIKPLISDNMISKGNYSIKWYGDTKDGFILSNGFYYIILGIDEKYYIQKFTFLK